MASDTAASYYTRVKPPSQDCEIEKMVTIEPVSLRRGGWRHVEGYVNSIRHLDPQFGVIIFFAVLTGIIFYLYWNKYKSIVRSSLYTTSSVAMLAISMSAILGIDFFSAVGAAFVAH